jgi:N-acetyl-anhydromuramyl-L-alanine amidase AmpD
MLKIERYIEFKPSGKQKKKKQIILCHTTREAEEYLVSLKFRYNGSYNKIPNYLIERNGKITQLLDNIEHSNFFSEENTNRNSIIISLENLGWLEKKQLSSDYINWKGSIYKQRVHEKKWRDFFFWEPYTNQQIQSTADLCIQICKDLNINKKCLGHNTKVDGSQNYQGIISRSNLSTRFTDLSPAFDFETFTKLLENE